MSRARYKRVAVALAIVSVMFLTGCGKSNSGDTVDPFVPGAGGGYYDQNGNLVPSAGGSARVDSQIVFSLANFSYANRKVLAGVLPQTNQSWGQVIIGGYGALPGTQTGYGYGYGGNG